MLTANNETNVRELKGPTPLLASAPSLKSKHVVSPTATLAAAQEG